MKTIIILCALLFASRAYAGTVTIQPGQCILIGTTNVCAASVPTMQAQPYYPNHQPSRVVVEHEEVQQLAPYAYCTLSEHKSPNTWDLYRQGGSTKHRMNQLVKSFPHFEHSDCQAEADKINQRS